MKPKLRDVLEARKWLADRGWGKTPEHPPAEVGDAPSGDALDRKIEHALQELVEQRLRKLGIVQAPGGADQKVPYIDYSKLDDNDLAQLQRILVKGQPDPKEIPRGGKPAHELLPGA